jgi:hypothetical protein
LANSLFVENLGHPVQVLMADEDTGLLTIRDDADTCNPDIAEPVYMTRAFIEKGDFTNGPDAKPSMSVAVHLEDDC